MEYTSLKNPSNMDNDALALRNKLKDKKPAFIRQDSHKVKSVAPRWRAPRGQHSKMRKKLKSYRRLPSIGWSSPASVRGLRPDGLKVILVHNVEDLTGCTEPVTLAASVGVKKRIEILQKANAMKLRVLNVKDPDAYIKAVQDDLKLRKDSKKAVLAKKEKVKEETKKKVEEKTKEETTEEKEKREQEEKRKVLEQR